jgi:guanylate kinase
MLMQSKFMAVLGPSGVGKTTIMHELRKLDNRFVLIKTHVTRPLRPGETDRVSLSLPELKEMRRKGEALQLNNVYGSYYAALPLKPIKEAISAGMFPMCDYKIPFAADLKKELSGALFCVYLIPPSFDAIKGRLEKDGRISDEVRIGEDKKEVSELDAKYGKLIDLKIVAEEGQVGKIAEKIRSAYLVSIENPSANS